MAQDLPPDEQDPPSALPRGTLLNDKFRVQRVIGVGGFGIVYLAHDEMSDVDVAIKEYMPASLAGRTKTMHVSLSSQSNAETFALGLKSFWNEARLLAKFRDEHLPLLKVYDAFQANGTAYMVMPVLRGRTAHQLRREMTKPPTERWLRTLLTDLLPALDRLHAENVYHRDIAPDNIQIDINGKPVLMDLGAARHVISNRTQSITAILKPGYAPIEQYGESEKLRQGPWTDIYALGATLHFLLLNKSPASATARIFDTGTPLVAHDLPGCSPAFLRVIDWMLEPRPEARPQSVEQLRTALFDSDDATVMMAPKRTVPPPVARAASPQPPPPPPPPQAMAPTMPFTTAPTQAAPRTAPPAAPGASAALSPAAAAATPSRSPPSPPTPVTPPRVSPPAAPAPSAHAVAPAEAKSPLPRVLAGVAALVLVAGAAVWLWPSSTPPAGASARTAPASAPEVSKAEPATAPRPETTSVSASVPTPAVAPVSPSPAVAVPTPAAPPPAPAPSPPVAATPAPPLAANPTAPDFEAARTAATAPTSSRRTPPTPVAAASAPVTTKKAAPINDKDGALLPKPADPSAHAAAAPAPAPPPPPAPAPVAPAPVVAAPAPANTVSSPTERCADKGGSIARRVCVAVVCGLPELHNHAECTALRRN